MKLDLNFLEAPTSSRNNYIYVKSPEQQTISKFKVLSSFLPIHLGFSRKSKSLKQVSKRKYVFYKIYCKKVSFLNKLMVYLGKASKCKTSKCWFFLLTLDTKYESSIDSLESFGILPKVKTRGDWRPRWISTLFYLVSVTKTLHRCWILHFIVISPKNLNFKVFIIKQHDIFTNIAKKILSYMLDGSHITKWKI